MAKLIDNFIIVATLKATEECEKHKGRNLLTKELVLIKTVKLDKFNADAGLKERVLNEIAVLKKIHSPAVLKLLKMLKSTHHLYLVYEYASEGLEDWQGSITTFLRMFAQVWREIARCGVIHGALRPSAVRFQDKTIKIGRFECARVVSGGFIAPKSYVYSAPEVLEGQSTSKSDVFSLGLILYWLAYGKLPYSGESSPTELKEFWTKTAQLELKECSKIDNELRPILSSMLEKDARSRCSWDQLWKLLQSEQSSLLTCDYTLARSVEDYSPSRRRKEQLPQQEQRSADEKEQSSRLLRLVLEYGKRRNKLSLLVSALKQLTPIAEPTLELTQITDGLILLIKRSSNALLEFAKHPSRTLPWVDQQTQKLWKATQLYELCLRDQFSSVPGGSGDPPAESELILALKNLETADNHRRRVRACIRQLSVLTLANNGMQGLQAAHDMLQAEQPLAESPRQLS